MGVEALTRFETTPTRPPDVWFAEAKEVGLGVELEMATLRSALSQLSRVPSGVYLSLNASPDTMMSEEFRDAVLEASAERLVLELTEHESIDDYSQLEKIVDELRSSGLRLAVDDAGAGFSSFRHILNLRPDIIKLDIGLTRGIDGDSARRALGSAMLTFGLDAYNAAIVAEGIETEAEFNTLRGLGCRFGQGYYLGRPGRLRPLDRLHDESRQLSLTSAEETQSTTTVVGEGVHDVGTGRPHLQAQSKEPQSLTSPVISAQRDVQKERAVAPRDSHQELLDLVAEIQSRSESESGVAKNRRSLSRMFHST